MYCPELLRVGRPPEMISKATRLSLSLSRLIGEIRIGDPKLEIIPCPVSTQFGGSVALCNGNPLYLLYEDGQAYALHKETKPAAS